MKRRERKADAKNRGEKRTSPQPSAKNSANSAVKKIYSDAFKTFKNEKYETTYFNPGSAGL